MLLVIYGLVILVALLFKVPKFYWLVCAGCLCLLVNTTNTYADLYNYTNIFDDIGLYGEIQNEEGLQGFIPLGWQAICLILYNLGFSYRGMIVLMIILSCFLIHCFVSRFNTSEGKFWALFMLFPSLVQCVQLRFFVASSIVFYFLQFLFIGGKNKRGILIYILGVFLAFLIHSSMIVFLGFIIVPFLDKLKYKTMIICALIICVITSLVRNRLASTISLLGIISESRMDRYIYDQEHVAESGGIFRIALLYIMSVAFSLFFTNQTHRPILRESTTLDDNNTSVIKSMNCFVLLMVFTLPLLLFDGSFFRFIEIGYCMSYCLGAWYWMRSEKPLKEKLLITLLFCLPIAYAMRIYYIADTFLYPFFEFYGFHSIFR